MKKQENNTKIRQGILLAFSLLVGSLIIWYASEIFLLAFAAVLLGVFLTFLGEWTQRVTKLPYAIALLTSFICFFSLLGIVIWMYTPSIVEQFEKLMEELPSAAENVRESILPYIDLEALAKSELSEDIFSYQNVFSQVSKIFSFTFNSIVWFVIFIVVGLYLAFTPNRYMVEFLSIIPPAKRKQASRTLKDLGHIIHWWLLGKIISMAAIGILTFAGLWLLDISLAFILGLLAALLAFIPYIGPIFSAVPAILLAFAQSPMSAVYVILLYVGIHILEGYFITPYAELKTVSIPPALTIFVEVLLTYMIGFLGLAIATPLLVVIIALVRQYYHEDQEDLEKIKKSV